MGLEKQLDITSNRRKRDAVDSRHLTIIVPFCCPRNLGIGHPVKLKEVKFHF